MYDAPHASAAASTSLVRVLENPIYPKMMELDPITSWIVLRSAISLPSVLRRVEAFESGIRYKVEHDKPQRASNALWKPPS